MNFDIFNKIAYNPEEQLQKYMGQGRKVVGCFPLYIPEPLIYAAGMLPFGMWGAEREIKSAHSFFPAYMCGIIQTNFELALQGKYNGISAVMVSSLCDSLKCAIQNWKYAVPGIEIIPVSYPQNRESSGAFGFLYSHYKSIASRLEKISGQSITNDLLWQAIEIYNEHNATMREFISIAGHYVKEITPFQRSQILKSSYFMDKREHTEQVKNLIYECKQGQPEKDGSVRVVTTGIIADNEDLLTILERNNISIVADDVVYESGQYRTDAVWEEDAMAALVKLYLKGYAYSTMWECNILREEHLVKLVRENNADGVIFFMTKFCDPEEYDYPRIREKLEKEEIPLLVLEVDKQIKNYGQAATAVQSFREMITL